MVDWTQLFYFSRTALPQITLAVFIIGVVLRLAKWSSFGFPRVIRPPAKKRRLIGVIKNWSINMVPPWDLAGRVEPVGYVVGIAMHIACIAILLGAIHEAVAMRILELPSLPPQFKLPIIPDANIPTAFPRRTLTYFVTPLFLSTLGILILRRLYYNLKGGPLKALTVKSDWVAAPLLWASGFTGFLAVISFGPYTPILTLHLILTQLFVMYLPYSKLIHSVTVFLVRTWFGFRRAIYGV